MNSKLTLLIAVSAACFALCLGQRSSLFTNTHEHVPRQSAQFVASKAVKQLKKAKSDQHVFEILDTTDRWELIQGKYRAGIYADMSLFSRDYCLKDYFDDRRAACKAATISSLKHYCEFCLEKYIEYCEDKKRSLLGDAWDSLDYEQRKIIDEVRSQYRNFDYFIDSTGDRSASEKENLSAYCKSEEREKAVESCEVFLGAVNDLAYYESDRAGLISFFNEKTGKSYEKTIEFCEMVVKQCKGFFPALFALLSGGEK